MKWYLQVWQNYANFSGRARRTEYWMFFLFNILSIIILAFIGASMRSAFLLIIYVLAALIPALAVAIRRMHDTGNSGWCVLIPFYSLILAVTPGTDGENQYGPDPKAEDPIFDFDSPQPFNN
jgi:uncharacterized membrane protein YhaH (DUF805 family)